MLRPFFSLCYKINAKHSRSGRFTYYSFCFNELKSFHRQIPEGAKRYSLKRSNVTSDFHRIIFLPEGDYAK